ncbi:MAG: DUF429 domain-containing protein [Bacteroidota bacterium]
MSIAGVDWFEGCWLAVVEGAGGVDVDIRRAASFAELARDSDLEIAVVDIPIGLSDRGVRACDLQARRMIRPRSSSVFPAPIRPMLVAQSRAEASAIRYAIDGKRCSAQAFAIIPIVADVDRSMTVDLQTRFREGHPEVSFAEMNGRAGLLWSKRTPPGQRERIELLEPFYPDLRSIVDAFEPRRARVDLLDAFAMLWSARRAQSGRARSIPDLPEYDPRGLRMEMVL